MPPDLDATIEAWLARAGPHRLTLDHQNEAMPGALAVEYGFADLGATSVVDLLDRVDGRDRPDGRGAMGALHTKVATTDADVANGVGVSIRFIEPGLLVRVAHAVATPSMVYFLLVFGLACLAFELTQTGVRLRRVSPAIVPRGARRLRADRRDPDVAVGVRRCCSRGSRAMVQDVRLRRLGSADLRRPRRVRWPGRSWRTAASPTAIRISPWLIVGATVASWLYYGFALTVAVQSRDRIIATQRGLIGLVGEARGRLAPDGPVHVKGAMWRGRSLGDPIAPGHEGAGPRRRRPDPEGGARARIGRPGARRSRTADRRRTDGRGRMPPWTTPASSHALSELGLELPPPTSRRSPRTCRA